MRHTNDHASAPAHHPGLSRMLMGFLLVFVAGGCAGPLPLQRAINPRDQLAYVRFLNASNGDGRTAYADWMARERDTTPEAILLRDRALSTTRNPFDAHRDPKAVSRGAVVYKFHCARCHGDDARGHGPSTLSGYPATNFKTFGKRLAATLHRGAPRTWYRVIRDGTGDVVNYPDEATTAMPSFSKTLTREQIWLVITYLQSLDRYAVQDGPESQR